MNTKTMGYGLVLGLIICGCAQVDDFGNGEGSEIKHLNPSQADDARQTGESMQYGDDTTPYSGTYPGEPAPYDSDNPEYPGTDTQFDDGNRPDNRASKTESCLGDLTRSEVLELIDISNPNTLVDEYDAQWRVNQIARIFARAEDPRGLFSTVYRLITNRAVESVENGDYEHPEWARSLITEFARRYLGNLHGHLVDGEVTGQWTRYYSLARNCDVGRGRTLGVAIAVHLMVDLPKTLYQIDSRAEQRDDFILFGDILLEIFPELITDIGRDYNTDVEDLLRGFFLGDWVDRLTSEGTMTSFMYQGIRMKAWRDSQNYRRFPHSVVDLEVRIAWGAADLALAKLDAVGAL